MRSFIVSRRVFQSTLSVRRATARLRTIHRPRHISIHALRKESDIPLHGWFSRRIHISIHALRKESDRPAFRLRPCDGISIHALRKESDPTCGGQPFGGVVISIHALRKESDKSRPFFVSVMLFQSTLSVRRATDQDTEHAAIDPISIHALRKESDLQVGVHEGDELDFNPRSP